jgi:hypothetical protein
MGVADELYDGTNCPQHRIRQGFQPTPTGWTGISTVFFESLDKIAEGVLFTDPEQMLTEQRNTDGYVDDTTNWMNRFLDELADRGKTETTLEEIQTGLTLSAQWWEELLHASGGKLELPKCFFYIVSRLFDSEGCICATTGNEMGDPTITL